MSASHSTEFCPESNVPVTECVGCMAEPRELRRLQADYERAAARTEELRARRDTAIRELVAAGHSHAWIFRILDGKITRSRIGQIAQNATVEQASSDPNPQGDGAVHGFVTGAPRSAAPAERPYRQSVPGPNVENVRSSAQAKRNVKPIPKRGT